METKDIEKIVHEYIKQNLKVEIKSEIENTGKHLVETVYLYLILNDEVISEKKIEGLCGTY